MRKNGIYRFDAEPAQLRVYAGEAIVTHGAETEVVGAGDLIALADPDGLQDFDVSLTDSLGLWNKSRSTYISTTHESTAKHRKESGNSPSGAWPRMPIPHLSH